MQKTLFVTGIMLSIGLLCAGEPSAALATADSASAPIVKKDSATVVPVSAAPVKDGLSAEVGMAAPDSIAKVLPDSGIARSGSVPQKPDSSKIKTAVKSGDAPSNSANPRPALAKRDSAKTTDSAKVAKSVSIVFAEGTRGYFIIRNERDSVATNVVKTQDGSVTVSLPSGVYSVEMEQKRNLVIHKRAKIEPGKDVSVTPADVERAVHEGVATIAPDSAAGKDSASAKNFDGSYVAFEMAWVIPVGAARRYSRSKFPSDALGMESGGYLGIAHNTNLLTFTDFFGIGFYGQWGLQANAMNSKYRDYYDVGYFGYDLAYAFRMEYEIGPSATFALGHKMFVDAYFKAGVALAFLPAFDSRYEDNSDDGGVADSSSGDYDIWNDDAETSGLLASGESVGESFGFGFAYGFGLKFRLSVLDVGVDVNLGRLKFNGDYSGKKVPEACVRLLFGGAF